MRKAYKAICLIITCIALSVMHSTTAVAGFSSVDVSTIVTWPLNTGAEGQTATYSENTSEHFASDYISLGTNLKYLDSNTTYNLTFTRFNPVSAEDQSPGEQNLIGFNIRPKTGLTFTPASVSFNCIRYGTDGGSIDVVWKSPDGTRTTLETALKPARNNSGAATQVTYDLSALTIPATQGECTLELYLYKLGTTKQVGIGNVVISGKVSGTAANVTSYTLATLVSPQNAGTIATFPVGTVFDEGTSITLTASRNFGFEFTHWANAAGTKVSEENPYSFTINANSELTAVFAPINTYALTLNVDGGAKDYMLSVNPQANMVNNQLMYEEGTTVTVNAQSNPIMAFTNWSTGETSSDIAVLMNSNHNITAMYSAVDYIVGWDFYKSGNGGRVADFWSQTDNEPASLIMRNADGITTSWLDKSQVAAGGYEGAPAAVNWKPLADKYYYQISFSAKDFTNLAVSADMLFNYNAYSVQQCEYSLDGTTFTQLGSYTLEAPKVWYNKSFSLPADANHAEIVYIRWIPDYSSTVVGTTATNDGTALSAIYVTGTSAVFNDGKAPVLVSNVPASGATNASASGKIVLTFDERVKISLGTKASLATKELAPVVSGKSITFEYTGLDYDTQYTFALAANTVSDLTDNALAEAITFSFKTMAKPVVAKKKFDFVVGVDGDFKAALAAARTASASGTRFHIFFPNGEYNIGENTGDANQMTTIAIPNISYIGQSADGVVLFNNSIQESINSTATIYLNGSSNNIYMQDLSLMNKMDFRTGSFKGRGVALWDQGNKNIFKNIRLLSNQDTYYTGGGRTYHENSHIHGTVDFICGGGDIYFNECLIYLEQRTGNCITAPATNTSWGYVFMNCTIDGFAETNNNYTLGRSWNNAPKSVYINTTMKVLPTSRAWGDPMNVVPSVFAEYNSMTSGGAAVDLSNRRATYTKDATTVTLNPVLTKEQADRYTIENVLGGNDNWQPRLFTEQANAPELRLDGKTLQWNNSDYVLCWGIFRNGQFVDFVTTNSYTIPEGITGQAVYTIRAANEMGGLGAPSTEVVITSKQQVKSPAQVIEIQYYTIDGKRLAQPAKGINLERTLYNDGTVSVKKILRKTDF